METKVTHLKATEVAERLRMSPATLADWRVKGKGPRFIKYGRVVLYPLDELEAWERGRLHQAVHTPATE